jgi:transcriptional regulator with XRE-family HTH domain
MRNGGKRLREIFARQRWDVADVASGIGVARSTIYTWTDTAPIDKLYAIAELIDVHVYELVDCYRPAIESTDTDQTGGDEN